MPPGSLPSGSTRPLTIALANETDGPGGAEVLLLQLAEELRRRGHRIVPVLPVRKEGWLPDQFHERGFETEHVRFPSLARGSAVPDLRRVFREREVDVVHSHEFAMSVYGAVAAGLLRIPHVITMHGNQTMTDARRRRVALRWAFRHSRAVAAVSRDTRRHLLESLGLPEAAVWTVPNGVPRRHGDPEPVRREFGLSADHVMLLAVGNLSVRKGHAVLVRSLERLEAGGLGLPWKLVIAGTGSQREPLEAQIQDAGLGGKVILAGHRDDVPALQAAADLFVMPSLWEGLPLAILEAMFAGNPVVATETSGIPEAIVHQRDGLLVPPGDDLALAQTLEPLLRDAEMRRRLGDAGQARALRDFTVERMAADYEALYRGGVPAGT